MVRNSHVMKAVDVCLFGLADVIPARTTTSIMFQALLGTLNESESSIPQTANPKCSKGPEGRTTHHFSRCFGAGKG